MLVFKRKSLVIGPDQKLHLAKEMNAIVFCMGIDWSRIMPEEPPDGFENAITLY
jgi:beta-glucosidase/6-phospho-beta-glucosidase/beta-galactosidase